MNHDETIAMIARCHQHQYPEDYGRPAVPPVDRWLIPIRVDPYTQGEVIPEESPHGFVEDESYVV